MRRGQPRHRLRTAPPGGVRIRDFDRPEALFQLEGAGLPDDFPAVRAVPATHHNLPVPPTRLIGREGDLARLLRALDTARLVTVDGTGGVGEDAAGDRTRHPARYRALETVRSCARERLDDQGETAGCTQRLAACYTDRLGPARGTGRAWVHDVGTELDNLRAVVRLPDLDPEVAQEIACSLARYHRATRIPVLAARRRRAGDGAPIVLRGFTVLVLTLLPGLLYLRFLKMRLQPLREEYLYNLHRLRIDSPQYLPEPPPASKFHERWARADGREFKGAVTIYELKFRTQYGFRPGIRLLKGAEGLGNIISVLVCTAILGAGLAAVVWYPPTAPGAAPLHVMLGFGFLGA